MATFCLVSPVLAVLLNLLLWGPMETRHPSQTRDEAMTHVAMVGIMPTLGIMAGVIALCGMTRYGTRGILWKALIGLLTYALLVYAALHTIHRINEITRKTPASQSRPSS